VLVLNEGKIEQEGNPKMDLFKHDANLMLRPKKNGYRHLAYTSTLFVDFLQLQDGFSRRFSSSISREVQILFLKKREKEQ